MAEDTYLLGRIALGDQGAFQTFFDRHSSVVLGFLIKMLRRRELAEEVLQEVFLQAWEQAERFRPQRATPRGWLLMLARSRALDRLRSSGARGRREKAHAEERVVLAAAANPVGTARLEAGDDKRRLEGALSLLSPEQRQCIELAFFEGLTHSELAERLQKPLGTVKSRILSGMRKLRDVMEAAR